MIVGPWGEVLACQDEGEGVVLAELDGARLAEVRRVFPHLSLRLEPRNLPPAVVFTARR
jgi:nitrilase